MTKRLLVIDGDELVYKAAFASQKKEHYIKFAEDNIQGPFSTREAAVEWIGDGEALEIFTKVVPSTEDAARFQMHRILSNIKNDVRPNDHRIYLTGEGNFREEVATIVPYKGNRVGLEKPFYYKFFKELLKEEHWAITVDGMEADDAMSITSWQHIIRDTNWDVIIGTQDKDLNMVPGFHYNPSSRESYELTLEEARFCFYCQLLTGDDTDNIPGIYRIAKRTAIKKLEPFKNGSSADLYSAVKSEYVKAEANPKIRSNMPEGVWGDERILEVARLLWMQQERGQMWIPEEDYYSY